MRKGNKQLTSNGSAARSVARRQSPRLPAPRCRRDDRCCVQSVRREWRNHELRSHYFCSGRAGPSCLPLPGILRVLNCPLVLLRVRLQLLLVVTPRRQAPAPEGAPSSQRNSRREHGGYTLPPGGRSEMIGVRLQAHQWACAAAAQARDEVAVVSLFWNCGPKGLCAS